MTEFYYVLITVPINWFLWTSLVVYSELYPNGWIDGIKGNGFEDAIKKREERWLWENLNE